MNEKTPFVTIVVISFNHEHFIERCLRSVIFQSYKDFQLLYLDNNSADQTFAKASALLKDSGINYIAEKSPENLGAAGGNNYLLNKYNPQSPYITLMAGDDWLDMDNFLYKVAYIKENPQYGMIYGNGYNYDNTTEELTIFYKTPSISGWILKELLEAPNINPEGIFYRTDIFREIGFLDSNAKVEDRDLWYRFARLAPVGYVHKPLTFYRVNHSNNISRNIGHMREGNEYFFKKYEKEFPREIAIARRKQWQYFAYHLATKEPGIKSLKFILKNYRANWLYNKQIIKCVLNMIKR